MYRGFILTRSNPATIRAPCIIRNSGIILLPHPRIAILAVSELSLMRCKSYIALITCSLSGVHSIILMVSTRPLVDPLQSMPAYESV